MCRNVKFENEEDQKIYEELKKEIDFKKEYEWLREMCLQLDSPTTFCHNDIQEGNILYIKEKEDTDLLLIDFDYSAYNYRGYDIANHFCEWMYEYKDEFEDGFKVYHDGYPTREEQLLFATEYLETVKNIKEKLLSGEMDPQRTSCDLEVGSVEDLLYEVNRFALASHLFWGLWSILQGHVSKIDFGYVKYAKARFDTYKKQKKELGY